MENDDSAMSVRLPQDRQDAEATRMTCILTHIHIGKE